MIFGKKSVAIVLVATIGLTLFIGLASAAHKPDPISLILNLVTGITTKVNQIQTDQTNTTMVIGTFADTYQSTSKGYNEIITITSNKPAIYTVTINMFAYPNLEDDYVDVQVLLNPSSSDPGPPGSGPGPGALEFSLTTTFTVAGYGVYLGCWDADTKGVFEPNLGVEYVIIVQGTKDTQVHEGFPF